MPWLLQASPRAQLLPVYSKVRVVTLILPPVEPAVVHASHPRQRWRVGVAVAAAGNVVAGSGADPWVAAAVVGDVAGVAAVVLHLAQSASVAPAVLVKPVTLMEPNSSPTASGTEHDVWNVMVER